MLKNLVAGVSDRAPGPRSSGRVVVVLEDLVAGVNGIDVGALGSQGLRELFTGIGNLRSALDALEVKATAAVAASGVRRFGTAQVLRETTGCSQRQARQRANRAETLSKMPKVTSALAEGAITPEHADAFVKAVKQPAPKQLTMTATCWLKLRGCRLISRPRELRSGPDATSPAMTSGASS